jgi:hypothetical protein
VISMVTGTFSGDFADWRDYSVTYYPFTSYDSHGAPTYGKSSTISCYFQGNPKLIRDSKGQQVVSSAQIYLVGAATYNVKDKFVLLDGQYPPILSIDHYYNDKATLELTVVYV